MSAAKYATIITGIAPLSIGEAIVQTLRSIEPDIVILTVDLSPNKRLYGLKNCFPIHANLNPFSFKGRVRELSAHIRRRIIKVLKSEGITGINRFIQSAGVYHSGPLIEHDITMRSRLLGVNLLARVELLHAIMSINTECGISNASDLTYLDIGAEHALSASPKRSLYCASKSFMIDFCASLQIGNEISRVVYAAPGPCDTPMLHRNHWSVKNSGQVEILDRIYQDSIDEYRSIFVQGNKSAFMRAIRRCGLDSERMFDTFKNYLISREQAKNIENGLLTAKECAKVIVNVLINESEPKSGIYLINSGPTNTARVASRQFSEISRRKMFRF